MFCWTRCIRIASLNSTGKEGHTVERCRFFLALSEFSTALEKKIVGFSARLGDFWSKGIAPNVSSGLRMARRIKITRELNVADEFVWASWCVRFSKRDTLTYGYPIRSLLWRHKRDTQTPSPNRPIHVADRSRRTQRCSFSIYVAKERIGIEKTNVARVVWRSTRRRLHTLKKGR